MANKEPTSHNLGVNLASIRIHNRLFRLDDRPGLSLVINTKDLVAQLIPCARTGGRKRLQDGDFALAIKDTAGIERGNTRNWVGLLGGVEVGDLRIGKLESWYIVSATVPGLVEVSLTEDDRIGRENGEVWMQFLEQSGKYSNILK